MRDMFTLGTKDLDLLKAAYIKMPKEFARASSDLLNIQVAEMKKNLIPKTINKTMTIRDDKFMNTGIRYTQSRPRTNINNQEAIVGSVFRPRFSGWKEQEFGTVSESLKSRSFSLSARDDNPANKIPTGIRLKQTAKIDNESNYMSVKSNTKTGTRTFTSKAQRTVAMIKANKKKASKKLFMVDPNGLSGTLLRFVKGFYISSRKRIRLIHNLEQKGIKPKHNTWMKYSVASMPKDFVVKHWIVLAKERLNLLLKGL